MSISDTAWTVAMSVIVIVALFVQRSARLVTVDDEPVPILDPDLWSFWLPLLIACLLAEIAIAIVVFVRGRWSWPIYAVFAVPQLVFAGAVLWLCASDEMLNPALIAGVDWGEMQDPARILNAALAVGVIGVTGWDLIEKARATMRS